MIIERPPDVEPVVPPDPEALIEEARRRQRSRRRRRLLVVGVVMGLAGAVGFGMSRGSGPSVAPAARAETRPVVVTTVHGFGGTVAFGALSRRSGVGQVYVLHPDGSVSQVTHGHHESDVVGWSPDGSHLLVLRPFNGGHDQVLYVMRADGSGITPLTRTSPGDRWAGAVSWSPDGSHIAFERYVSFGSGLTHRSHAGVVIAAWNGRRVTGRVWLPGDTTEGVDMASPWSPDGLHLALVKPFVIFRNGKFLVQSSNIDVVRVDGSGQTALTRTDRSTCRPSLEGKGDWDCQGYGAPIWSPDGRTITATRGTPVANGERADVVRLTPSGEGLADMRVLRTLPQNSDALLPTSRALLLSFSNRSGLYTTDPDGDHTRRIAAISSAGLRSWSPDGSRVTFFDDHSVGHQMRCTLYAIAADGSHVTRLDARHRPYTADCKGRSGPFWRPVGG